MNDNIEKPYPPWLRWLIEIGVIVASILLAFGIEAWWDERKERQEEQQILAGLEREYEIYRGQFEFSIERHRLMMDAMLALLQAMENGQWQSADLSLDEAIGRLLWPPTNDIGGGVTDALVQAGNLGLISDFTLREKLATWPGFYAEVMDDELMGRDLVFDKLMPHLAAQAYNLSGVVGHLVNDPSAPAQFTDGADETRRLLADAQLRTLVQLRMGYWEHSGQEYAQALDATNEVLNLIRAARRAP